MNGHEQREHRTVTAELGKRLDDTEVVVSAIEKQLAQLAEIVRRDIGQERTHRLELAVEQRAYVDARDRELRTACQQRWESTAQTTKRLGDAISAFRDRRFLDRLKWMVTGR